MNLKKEILKADFKDQAELAALQIGNDEYKFGLLMELFFSNDYRTCQRASWVLAHCIDNYPHLIEPYLNKMVNNLYKEIGDATKRNTVRALQFVNIPENLWGETIEICFRFLHSGIEPVAVKVFSMSVLCNLSAHVPEIKEELQISIEDQLPLSSSGFKSRGKKILQKLLRN